ncbi:hypothetical protein LTR08_002957 [Meristemomyces frigidus]|nr:hypothetical protein LTR08_002957 [Meristemomyces frigidus]
MSHLSNPAPTSSAAGLHTLILSFPVAEMMQTGVAHPHLEPPTYVEQREAPPETPSTAGIHDPHFFARLTVQPRNAAKLRNVQSGHHGLLTAVAAACEAPGTSTLEVVSYVDPRFKVLVYDFRLRTWLQDGPGPAELHRIIGPRWAALLRIEGQVAWIRLLNNLVRRASARAYYHVREQLVLAYGEQGANAEEAAWKIPWHASPSRSVQDLLMARLCAGHGNAGPSLLAGGGSLVTTPPCGHRSTVRKIGLLALTSEGSASYSCAFCGARALQEADDDELGVRDVVLGAQAFVENYGPWVDLDGEIAEAGHVVELLTASAMMCALRGTLASFELPVLISPPELSFIGLHETQVVLAGLEVAFGEGYQIVCCTPRELYDNLLSVAQSALWQSTGSPAPLSEATLPPGWTANIKRWFTLAVRLVSDRQCDVQDTLHAGLHLHDGDFYLGVLDVNAYAQMEDDEMEHDGGGVTSMDDLSQMLNGSSLLE